MSNAESIGFEPMDQFPDHGLANRSFDHSGNSPLLLEWADSNRRHLTYQISALNQLSYIPMLGE